MSAQEDGSWCHTDANTDDVARSAANVNSKGPAPDLDEAQTFLTHWYGNAPRQLVSITPDGRPAARCLWPQQPLDERSWIDAAIRSGKNVYFHVNQPGSALDKKAEKKDIREVRALHVDIDPANGELPEACKRRALNALAAFSPPPSVVVDSGGGVQAFWLLEEPVILDGTIDTWGPLEAYNIALEVAFGGDSCHNVDRIMRLPGTLNVPNQKKISKGRTLAEAHIVQYMTTWARYPLRLFTPAPKRQHAGAGGPGLDGASIKGNRPHFATIDDLPVPLNDYTRMLIVNGLDVDYPTKYPSRSEVLWRVCCEMVRAGADDETIAAVILNPAFKISASVLDKRRPEESAAQQIARARLEAEDPYLAELNKKHFVVESIKGGKCMVAEEESEYSEQIQAVTYQSFDAFAARYSNRHLQVDAGYGKKKSVSLARYWFSHSGRRQYRRVVFRPGSEVSADEYNLWRGFSCDAQPGEKHQPLLVFLREVVCNGDAASYSYLICWLARLVQRPGQPGQVAIVLRGLKGTGKGFFANMIGSMMRRHFISVASAKLLVGEFNGHLRDKVLVFADEAFLTGDKSHDSSLKAMVTEPQIMIEAKGSDAEPQPNCLHLIMASNSEYVVPATPDERRFLVLDVSNKHMRDSKYFGALGGALESGGRENLLHFLLHIDLTGFDVRDVPDTAGLDEQKTGSLSGPALFLLRLLEEGQLPNNMDRRADLAATMDLDGTQGEWSRNGLYEAARRLEPKAMKDVSLRQLTKFLREFGCISFSDGRRRGWKFPPLEKARAIFSRRYARQAWDESVTEWQPAAYLQVKR